MPGIPSAEGSGDDRNPNWFFERFPPYSTSVREFLSVFNYDMDLVAKMLSGLSHLPIHERIEALRKKAEEHLRSKAHTSDDEDEDDEDEQDEDEMDKDEKDIEGETLKLIDDEKKPRHAEEHQVRSECKKPRLAECVEKPEARETNNRNNPFTRQ